MPPISLGGHCGTAGLLKNLNPISYPFNVCFSSLWSVCYLLEHRMEGFTDDLMPFVMPRTGLTDVTAYFSRKCLVVFNHDDFGSEEPARAAREKYLRRSKRLMDALDSGQPTLFVRGTVRYQNPETGDYLGPDTQDLRDKLVAIVRQYCTGHSVFFYDNQDQAQDIVDAALPPFEVYKPWRECI